MAYTPEGRIYENPTRSKLTSCSSWNQWRVLAAEAKRITKPIMQVWLHDIYHLWVARAIFVLDETTKNYRERIFLHKVTEDWAKCFSAALCYPGPLSFYREVFSLFCQLRSLRVFEWSMNKAVGQCDHRFPKINLGCPVVWLNWLI